MQTMKGGRSMTLPLHASSERPLACHSSFVPTFAPPQDSIALARLTSWCAFSTSALSASHCGSSRQGCEAWCACLSQRCC